MAWFGSATSLPEVWLGKKKKTQEVDFSLGSQNKTQRQDSVMGSSALQDRSWILLPLLSHQGSTWEGPDFIPSLEPVSLSQCGIFPLFLGIKATRQERAFVWFSGKINKLLSPMIAPGQLRGQVSVVWYHWGSDAANPHQKMQTQYWEGSLPAMFGFSQLNREQKLSCFCFVLFPTGKSRRLLPCL